MCIDKSHFNDFYDTITFFHHERLYTECTIKMSSPKIECKPDTNINIGSFTKVCIRILETENEPTSYITEMKRIQILKTAQNRGRSSKFK